jgi:hypothetical protein
VKSPYLFNLRNWEFQNKIPVIYSEYTTRMIPFYEYSYLLQGASKFNDFKNYPDHGITNRLGSIEYQDMVYVFVMKDLPAFKDESFITSANDYLIKLDFQLAAIHHPDGANQAIMTTWQKLSEEMIDNVSFGKYLKNCTKKGKEITDTMKLTSKKPIEKARTIDRLVKTNYNWNGHNDKFTTKSLKDFLVSKTGNSCEINLFLTGLLNSAGIEAYPVILSTRTHGKIKYDYPFHHFFNSVAVLAKIDSLTLLLDATDPFCDFNEIPTRSINDKGLIIQKNKVEWVDLKNYKTSSTDYRIDIKANNSNDSIYETYKLITDGYDAVDYRNKFTYSFKELKNNLLGNNQWSTDSIKPLNLNQIENPFELDYTKRIAMEKIENKIIINPFCNNTLTENPLKQAFRNYPVDLIYRKANKFQATITIPAGYKLISKPENMTINNNLVKIIYFTENQGDNIIKVVGVYEFKKDIYGSSDYFDLKGYFNKIVDKFNEKLVLEKTM